MSEIVGCVTLEPFRRIGCLNKTRGRDSNYRQPRREVDVDNDTPLLGSGGRFARLETAVSRRPQRFEIILREYSRWRARPTAALRQLRLARFQAPLTLTAAVKFS